MKKINYIFLLMFIITIISCTKNFKNINQNISGRPVEDFPSKVYLQSIMRYIYPDNGDGYGDWMLQATQNLNADIFAGYFNATTPFNGGVNTNGYSSQWDYSSQTFSNWSQSMSYIGLIRKSFIARSTPEDSIVFGMALVTKVLYSQIAADYYGTLPYTTFGSLSAAYDDLETIYNQFFKELDTALMLLNPTITTTPGIDATIDLLYAGNQQQWVKLANSLRMRVAMRIVKVDPTIAKAQCEKAMSNTTGLILDNTDNATFHASVYDNSLWVITYNYNDNFTGADMACYLKGKIEEGGVYDPRLTVYISPVDTPTFAGSYVGIRLGSTFVNFITIGRFSKIGSYLLPIPAGPSQADALIPLFIAAETNFLLAEASLRNWSMGTYTQGAEAYYKAGISASMNQWGVNIPSDYYSNSDYVKTNYKDPILSSRDIGANNRIANYNFDGSNELKLEKIITQKWIASWPAGSPNTWSEYRRTGYPKLFPSYELSPGVTIPKTIAWGGLDSVNNARKLQLPLNEYTNNTQNVNKAVSEYFGGIDNIGTHVWWDVNLPNF